MGEIKTCKTCRNCGETKSLSDFTKRSKTGEVKSDCKKCRSVIVYRAYLEKQLEINPSKYIECDCDNIYSVRRKKCHKCGLLNPLKESICQ